MTRIKILIGFVCAVCLTAWSAVAGAATELYTQVTVYTILVEEGSYGGCMAKTDLVNFANDGLTACPDGWLTLDCEGNYGSKSIGQAKLGAMQLAYVSGRKVNVTVDDSQDRAVSNQYCWAKRVDSAP